MYRSSTFRLRAHEVHERLQFVLVDRLVAIGVELGEQLLLQFRGIDRPHLARSPPKNRLRLLRYCSYRF